MMVLLKLAGGHKMVKIFVLIMVMGGQTSQSGVTTITQEFNSFENCEKARLSIVNNIYSRGYPVTPIKAQGCFEK